MDTAEQEHEGLPGLPGFEWTDQTLSTLALSRQLGQPTSPRESPVQVCAGAYAIEEGPGGSLVWRFYRDPEWYDEVELCECGRPINDGDDVYSNVDGGFLHAACAGTDPEHFQGEDGEYLKPTDVLPMPFTYRAPTVKH